MSNQNNRFLLPHSNAAAAAANQQAASSTTATSSSSTQNNKSGQQEEDFRLDENQLSVDTDFDSYWEEEARNPHRNRIRIGRQYQASVPQVLKQGERDSRKLEDLETLTFCPKKSAKVSDSELDHYFTIAKSLNLFASLVETRSLLGRDVTIADLNHIRHKEGLSLASVIQPQPARLQSSNYNNSSPASSQQLQATTSTTLASTSSPHKSPPTTNCDTINKQQATSPTTTASTTNELQTTGVNNENNYPFKQPLMKALSHFINLHHPCHHDNECKKLLKDIPLDDDSAPVVSITAGNLRQGTSGAKAGRSRSSLKNQQIVKEEAENHHSDDGDASVQSPSFEEWTREEMELFSKAIEVCGKNFSSIKKDFLPSKSVKSIVEYYYIGSRDASEGKKKSQQSVEISDGCSSPEKPLANNNSQGGNGGPAPTGGKSGSSSNITGPTQSSAAASTTTSSSSRSSNNDHGNKSISDHIESDALSTPQKQNKALNKNSKTNKVEVNDSNGNASSAKTKTNKNIDARMSVYNFDEEVRDDSPIKVESPKPGAEVRPLKAKPILPNATYDSDPTNSEVGSLKFFMDGQLVLKLNACQEQQEGTEKCHWVQSGERATAAGRQKRNNKRSHDKTALDSHHNGSHSNSVVSSYLDDDSKNEDLTNDEDSKESANSFTNLPQQNQQQASPQPNRKKVKNEVHQQSQPQSQMSQPAQLSSPINYNRLAVNNRMKERNDMNQLNNINQNNPNPLLGQAIPPWFQANHFAVAAALLSGLPFSPNAGNIIDNNNLSPNQQSNVTNNSINNNSTVNLTTKPMDLSLEHSSPKSLQRTSTSRSSRSKPKTNNH